MGQSEQTMVALPIESAPGFQTKAGVLIPGFTASALVTMRQALLRDYSLTTAQLCEGSAYSMAMVVRTALGLSAAGGRICALASDTVAGCVALATVRHLANAGAEPFVVLVDSPPDKSQELEQQVKPLQRMGVPVFDWAPSEDESELTSLLESCHNSIVGLLNPASFQLTKPLVSLIEMLNELPTPIHCIEGPLGIHPDTGALIGSPIFASSTLSLGAPLTGLNKARDYVGRHYLCDNSIPREVYEREGQDLTLLFADQPVIQIEPT